MNGLKLEGQRLEGRLKGDAIVTRAVGRVKPRVTRRRQTARIVVFPRAVALLVAPVAICNIQFSNISDLVRFKSNSYKSILTSDLTTRFGKLKCYLIFDRNWDTIIDFLRKKSYWIGRFLIKKSGPTSIFSLASILSRQKGILIFVLLLSLEIHRTAKSFCHRY